MIGSAMPARRSSYRIRLLVAFPNLQLHCFRITRNISQALGSLAERALSLSLAEPLPRRHDALQTRTRGRLSDAFLLVVRVTFTATANGAGFDVV
jgi:hypothetical protein